MGWLFRAYRYLNQQEQRPLLPGGYERSDETRREPTYDEMYLIALRYARTPDQARALLHQHGGVAGVIANVKQPQRKAPPRWARFKRLVRKMFP